MRSASSSLSIPESIGSACIFLEACTTSILINSHCNSPSLHLYRALVAAYAAPAHHSRHYEASDVCQHAAAAPDARCC
jgi:hypothetical protein